MQFWRLPFCQLELLTRVFCHYIRDTLIGATGWTRTSHTQIFSLLLYLMSYRGIKLVDRKRIELLPETCKAPVLPLSLTAHKLGGRYRTRTDQAICLQSKSGCPCPSPIKLAPKVGIEPTTKLLYILRNSFLVFRIIFIKLLIKCRKSS